MLTDTEARWYLLRSAIIAAMGCAACAALAIVSTNFGECGYGLLLAFGAGLYASSMRRRWRAFVLATKIDKAARRAR